MLLCRLAGNTGNNEMIKNIKWALGSTMRWLGSLLVEVGTAVTEDRHYKDEAPPVLRSH